MDGALLLGLCAVAAGVGAPPPPTGPTATAIPLTAVDPGAVCLNGVTAHMYVYQPSTPSTDWVVQLGLANGGAGQFCFEGMGVPDNVAAGQIWSCQFQAKPPAPGPPPPPPPPIPLNTFGGIFDVNCTRNPTFCGANKVIIDACDGSLYMGSGTVMYNGTKLTFAGDRILNASVAKLATLGLDKAVGVVLTGVTHAATSVVLKADAIGDMVSAVNPGLKKFRAVPADGFTPQFHSFFDLSLPGVTPRLWFDEALESIFNLSNAKAGMSPECVSRQRPNETYKCLYAAEAMMSVKTPTFSVQQMPGVWAYQCDFDGRLRPYMECSSHSSYFRGQYMCVQYPDLCSPQYVANFSVPLQQRYLDEAKAAGLTTAGKGHGGFYFSCFLGSYWEMLFDWTMVQPSPPGIEHRSMDSVWNQIAIGSVTMQQAVTAWWNDQAGAAWHQDTLWNPQGQPPHPPDGVDGADGGNGVDAPPVPWYTSRFFTNPTCRGYPWY